MQHGDKQAPIAGQGAANLGGITVDPRQIERVADHLNPTEREVVGQGALVYGVALCREADRLRQGQAADRGAGLDIEQLALTFAQRFLPGFVTKDTRYTGAAGAQGGTGNIIESAR
jgi:hypothetical protein